ncbi:hypothetical protein [Nonomuraea dietziae]|uniref:hypothetical protein n=1 Tax=Nonomuraea dietziae TaxID=65515 RepID=UPI0031DE3024
MRRGAGLWTSGARRPGNRIAGEHYGLVEMVADIGDRSDTGTRFVRVSAPRAAARAPSWATARPGTTCR